MKKLFILFLASFVLIGCGEDKEDKLLYPYKDVANVFLNALVNGDGERACNMLVPVVLEENYESLDECKQDNSKYKKSDGDVTYKITKEKRLLDEEFNEWIGESADYYGIGRKDISEVIKYEAEIYRDKEMFIKVYFNVVNYNNKWLIVK